MGSGSRSLSLSGEIVSSKDDSSREILILDSLDSIVLSQDASTPVIEPGKIQTIKLQEGLYLFSLGNIFTQSIIQTNSLSIEPLATGIFFIDVRPSVTRVYSATAPLKITLTQA